MTGMVADGAGRAGPRASRAPRVEGADVGAEVCAKHALLRHRINPTATILEARYM